MKKYLDIKWEGPSVSRASLWIIYIERMKQIPGKILNYFHIPGFVKPLDTHDKLTKTHIKVRLSGFFTVISINGRDYYFCRFDGKFDGTGMVFKCSTPPVDCILV